LRGDVARIMRVKLTKQSHKSLICEDLADGECSCEEFSVVDFLAAEVIYFPNDSVQFVLVEIHVRIRQGLLKLGHCDEARIPLVQLRE